MKVLSLDALSHLKVKSTSTRKVIKKGEQLAQKVDYPKCQKPVYVYKFDYPDFFHMNIKVISKG